MKDERFIEAIEGFNLKKGLILTEDEFDELKIDGRQINVLPVWYWLLAPSALSGKPGTDSDAYSKD